MADFYFRAFGPSRMRDSTVCKATVDILEFRTTTLIFKYRPRSFNSGNKFDLGSSMGSLNPFECLVEHSFILLYFTRQIFKNFFIFFLSL